MELTANSGSESWTVKLTRSCAANSSGDMGGPERACHLKTQVPFAAPCTFKSLERVRFVCFPLNLVPPCRLLHLEEPIVVNGECCVVGDLLVEPFRVRISLPPDGAPPKSPRTYRVQHDSPHSDWLAGALSSRVILWLV